MKLATVTVAALLAIVFTSPPVRADADGHVNFFLGQKSLSNDWEPVEDQLEFGAVMSFGEKDWPVHIAVDVLVSGDEDSVFDPVLGTLTVTGSTFEIDAGVRKIWKKGKVLPYIGGGLGLIGGGFELTDGFNTFDADDAALGYWADTGVFFRLGSHFNLGLDLRYSSATVDADFGNGVIITDVDAGGFSYGLLVGFGW